MLSGKLASGGRLRPGWLEIRGERLGDVGWGAAPRRPDERPDGVIAPGLCDIQVNGAGGHEVTGGAGALDAIDALLLAHGVTSYLPTLITTEPGALRRAIDELDERIADPRSPVAGVHLEGPFLSPAHAGVHRRSLLRAPGAGLPCGFEAPAVRLVTLAPELPGALELIAQLRRRGIAVALGHSGASADVARQAIDAGARLVTHVFNAMGPLHHRAPGLVGLALVDRRVTVAVIPDGLHVDSLVLELVRRAAGARVALVSDASPAAEAPPGDYAFAGTPIVARTDGSVRTAAGRLAGSGITLDVALRRWLALTGASLAVAARAASERPAAAVGLPSGLRPGGPADLVLLDTDGAVRRVMRRGAWLE